MVDKKITDLEQAKTILADDTNSKGGGFLERVDEKHWRIVLPGEYFIITVETLHKLAGEHLITADRDQKEIFLPARR